MGNHFTRTGFMVALVCFVLMALYGFFWQKVEDKDWACCWEERRCPGRAYKVLGGLCDEHNPPCLLDSSGRFNLTGTAGSVAATTRRNF